MNSFEFGKIEKIDENTVKPCPFCGGKEIIIDEYKREVGNRYRIVCLLCMAMIDTGYAQNKYTVIEMWNKRKDDKRENKYNFEVEKGFEKISMKKIVLRDKETNKLIRFQEGYGFMKNNKLVSENTRNLPMIYDSYVADCIIESGFVAGKVKYVSGYDVGIINLD